MRLSNLSRNMMIIMEELIKNQKICKLLRYHSDWNPYLQDDISDPSSLIGKEIFLYPIPINSDLDIVEKMELRIYYDNFNINKGGLVEGSIIFFDVIYSKSDQVYLMNDGESKFKPLELVTLIVNQLKDDIPLLGSLHFSEPVTNVFVNHSFNCYRLVAKVFSTSE